MISRLTRVRGVSLLEAIVALAVMAIGAVGIVGLQVSLRHNADLSKQRSEATRLAQEVIEQWKGFTTFGPSGGQVDWSMIATSAPTTHVGSNVTFTRTITVAARGEVDDDPRSKSILVRVDWADSSGQPQAVQLNSMVAGISPELAGSLTVPMRETLLMRPGWRHPSIPAAAVDQVGGTSAFTPPGSPSPWIFQNSTGLILHTVCPPAPASCIKAVPLYGFVRFATSTSGPTAADAELPSSPPLAGIQVVVNQTAPIGPQAVSCFHQIGSTDIAYFCAVPINAPTQMAWSGQAVVEGVSLSASVADPSNAKYRVCRYTPVRNCNPIVGDWMYGAAGSTLSCTDPHPTATPPTPRRKMMNVDHPLQYVNADTPLVGQNFLVILGGNGAAEFDCPVDDTTTPNVQGSTWHHQPSS